MCYNISKMACAGAGKGIGKMWRTVIEKKGLPVLALEALMLVAYALFSVVTYQKTEIVFTAEDMQLQNADGSYIQGG